MSASFGSMIDHGRKQVASWNLSSIPGCVSHHMADRGVTIGGGVVTNLAPRLGTWNFAPPLAGDSPTLDVGGMSPYPGIVFDGTDYLQVTAATPLSDFRFLHDGTGCTLVMIFDRLAAAVSQAFFATNASNANLVGVFLRSGSANASQFGLVISNGTGAYALAASSPVGTFVTGKQIFTYSLTAASYLFRSNGTTVASGGALLLSAADPAYRASVMGSGVTLDTNGVFGEIAMYNRVLTTSELVACDQYAKYRYGALVL